MPTVTTLRRRQVSLFAFGQRCQKPRQRVVGNWLARQLARPLALRLTHFICRTGCSANLATGIALGVGVLAAVAFGTGTFALGCLLFLAWYVLDHVDGQLARWHGTASLDGVALDYLMHHLVNLLIPAGLGHGLAVVRGEPVWLYVGATWGVAWLVQGLVHDSRYKAFLQRIKRFRGQLQLAGGSTRPSSAPPLPRSSVLRTISWGLRKACEVQVVLIMITGLVLWQFLLQDRQALLLGLYTSAMAVVTTALAMFTVVRGLQQQAAEHEFQAWYAPPTGFCWQLQAGSWSLQPQAPQTGPVDLDPIRPAQHTSLPTEGPRPARCA